MHPAMQQLTSHYNRKKSQFVNFFSSIIQVIQKLAHDIQIQIDKQYFQSATEFKNYEPNVIINACIKMEQNRVQVYHEMIDRLYETLKGFMQEMIVRQKKMHISHEQKKQNSSAQSQQSQQLEQRKSIQDTLKYTDQQSKPIRSTKQPNEANASSQVIRLGQSREVSRQLQPRTPQNSNKFPHQPTPFKIPSPFAQKQRQNQLKQSASQEHPQSSTQRSKQKIQILKKTDVCQSLDNYLNRQAKQMLERSLSRQSSYSSMRRSMSKKYETPQRSKYSKEYDSSQIDRRIEEKLGGYQSGGKYQAKGDNYSQNNGGKRVVENMVSPIQKYKMY